MELSADTPHVEPADRVRVLYIAGGTRSGSTIVGMVLGEISGLFFGGELIDFWRLVADPDHRCSCGVSFSACPVWHAIKDAGVGGLDPASARELVELRDRHARSHRVPARRWRRRDNEELRSERARYSSHLRSLYGAIQRHTGCDVVVDSSKNAGYAERLAEIAELDVSILHLVRDPRATAFSWRRRRTVDELEPRGLLASTLQWGARNIGAEILSKSAIDGYLRMRYEDFVVDPRAATESIVRFLGLEGRALPFKSAHDVELGPNHGVWGNMVRGQRGSVALRADDEWLDMRARDRLPVTALTLPLLLRYRYPIVGATRKKC